jgi:hypothetical protein
VPSGSNTEFIRIPCRLGLAPVIIVVCAGNVTLGMTLVAPVA